MSHQSQKRFGLTLGLSATFLLALVILFSLRLAGLPLSFSSFLLALLAGFVAALLLMALYVVLTRFFFPRAILDRSQASELAHRMNRAEEGDFQETWPDVTLLVHGRPQQLRLSQVYHRLVRLLADSNRMSRELNDLTREILSQAVKLSQSAEDQSAAVAASTAAVNNIDVSLRQVVGSVEDLADLGENVSSATYEMIANVEEVSRNAESLHQAATEAVSATEEMVKNIRVVAASTDSLSQTMSGIRRSMEEIEKATRAIRDRAEETAAVSASAQDGAAEAKTLLSQTVASVRALAVTMESAQVVMRQLGVHSRAIGEILTVISSVASDTHLLSLNASIMAARAGEHGRGFSVVAQEIKTLAQRTTESAKEIERLIFDTQESVERAVSAIDEGKAQVTANLPLSEQADRALAEVLERVEIAARNAHEIAAATMEQAETNAQVFKAVEETARRTDQIRAAMRDQEEASDYVRQRALANHELVDQVVKAMKEQSQSSHQISAAMDHLTASIQNIRLAAEDQTKASAGIVQAVESIRTMADLVAISAQNVSNTAMSVLHHSLLLRHELKPLKIPSLPAVITIGVLFDNLREERWRREREIFERRITDLGVRPEMRVAEGSARQQETQAEDLIKSGVDLLIVVAVDAEAAAGFVRKARAAGIPVIAYDRLIKNCELDLFVSFDAVRIGRLQAETALHKMTGPRVLIVAGSPTDMNAHFLYQGQKEVLKPRLERKEIELVDEIWVPDWEPEKAYQLTRQVIERKGPVDAVVAANDGIAGGAIRAISELIRDRRVMVTGLDTDLAACRRIVEETQTMTVYMPIKLQASRAIEAALLLLQKEEIPGITDYISNGTARVPAILLKPIKIDRDNLDEVVIKEGFHPREAIYGA